MKAKTAIVTILVSAALAGGGGFAAFQKMRGGSKPVEVVSVASANYGVWDYDTSTISGTIVSRDSQKVDLNTEYPLTNVYVKEGEKVKKGDKLMEYDMTMPELQQEMEQLTHQLLEIRLDKENAELVKLNNGAPLDDDSDAGSDLEADVDSGDDEDDNTQSADGLIEEDGGEEVSADKAEDSAAGAQQDDAGSAATSDLTTSQEPTTQNATGEDEETQQFFDDNTDSNSATAGKTTGTEKPEKDTESNASSFIEDDAFSVDQETVTPGTPTGTSAETAVPGATETLGVDNVKAAVKEFLELATSIQNAKTRESAAGLIASARVQWDQLTKSDSEYKANGLAGNEISIPQYQLSKLVQENTTQDDRDKLYLAYAMVLDKNVRRQLDSIFSVVSDVTGLTEETLKTAGADAVTAYDEYNAYVKSLKDYPNQDPQPLTRRTHNAMVTMFNSLLVTTDDNGSEVHTKYFEELSQLAAELLARSMIETESEPVTEAPYNGDFGGGDFGSDGGDDSYTAEERAEAIRAKKSEIAETKLQIRESDLKLKQYARTLDEKVVTATMDGIVQTAGTVEGGGSQDGFIVISGQKGMYVKGTLSEMNLDKVKVGDMVTGQDYDTGSNFTAQITEISPYPMDSSESDYFFFGSSGASASYYPFYAYIENSEGFSEDSSVDLTVDQSGQQSGTGLYIDAYYVRMDESGKYYAFVQGKDGKLEKRYVKAIPQDGGYVTQITGGLSNEDYIAFPYGKNTVQGADTIVVDSLGDSSLG